MKQKYDIAAFVWPSFAPDERARIFWPQGFGEWESIISHNAKFPLHEQPPAPLWGYCNESDPYVMEMQIEAAIDHGVNVFIYDWYWYDRMPFLENSLNNGFLKAKNCKKMQFYIMWANHNVGLTWDKRNADLSFHGKDTILWNGSQPIEQVEIIFDRIIEKYFSQENYYKIDGKPVFMLYDLYLFIQGVGGARNAQKAFELFREKTIKAGFPGLELQLCVFSTDQLKPSQLFPGDAGVKSSDDVIKKMAFDSLTHYQFCHMTNINRDYSEILKDVLEAWAKMEDTYNTPYYPHVSVGWDTSVRANTLLPDTTKNNPPEEFEKALLEAKKYIDSHPNQAPLITINSWNEWTESSCLQPSTTYGYGYLEAIKKVFKEK